VQGIGCVNVMKGSSGHEVPLPFFILSNRRDQYQRGGGNTITQPDSALMFQRLVLPIPLTLPVYISLSLVLSGMVN